MYAALWRALPGPTVARVAQAALLMGVVVAMLFSWVFPSVERHLPFVNVTVVSDDQPGVPAPQGPPTPAMPTPTSQ